MARLSLGPLHSDLQCHTLMKDTADEKMVKSHEFIVLKLLNSYILTRIFIIMYVYAQFIIFIS